MAIWKKQVEKSNEKKEKKEVKKNTRTKYDWISLKQEFMESDFIDVAPFLRQSIKQDTANNKAVANASKWWADEKRKIQQEMKQKALEDFKKNLKTRWENVFDVLDQAHVKWLEDLANMILEQWEMKKRKISIKQRDPDTKEVIWSIIMDIDDIVPHLHQSDMINILKHIKLEKWEPTDIVDNDGKSKARTWLEEMKQAKKKK